MTLDCHSDHCITCGDEGIAMTVLKIDEERCLALCEASDGARSSVEIALIDNVNERDEVLVHAGVALVRLDDRPADGGPRRADLIEAKPR